MAVEEHEAPGSGRHEVLADGQGHLVEQLVADAHRAGELGEARGGAKGHGRHEEQAGELLLHEVGDFGGREQVGAQRVVPAVLLDGAKDQKHGVVLGKVGLDLGPGGTFKAHGRLPSGRVVTGIV